MSREMSQDDCKTAALHVGWRLKPRLRAAKLPPPEGACRQNPPSRVEMKVSLPGVGSPRRRTWWPQAPSRDFSRQSERPYLHELDRLRIITALSVVAVHVLAFTMYFDPTPFALLIHMGVLMTFHFTREVFMFVTAFALVYVYYGKPFLLGRFWKRRGLGVVLPYVIWTAIYVWVNFPMHGPLDFLQLVFVNVLTGNASYQLYYILLTIQFYVLFPLFLKFLRRVQHRPWLTLGVSFAIEVVLLTFFYYGLPLLPLPGEVSSWLGTFTDRFVLDYQFYFLLGAIAALYLEQMRAWMLRHSRWVIGGICAGLAALWLYYLVSTQVFHVDIGAAVAVLQPIMVPFSLAVVVFLYWMAYSGVVRARTREGTRGQRIWHTFSDASFGLYLVHPLFLSAVLAHVIPPLLTLPSLFLVPLTWLLTAAGSLTFTIIILRIPYLSRLVGREGTKQPRKPGAAQHISTPAKKVTEQPLSPQPITEGNKG
jgi:peptidoglycan/LPS O-acetylase OafA/YrhL